MSSGGKSVLATMRRFLSQPWSEKVNQLEFLYYRLKGRFYYRHMFASFGAGSVLYKPMLLSNPHFMHIGNNVTIRQGARLEAIQIDPENPPELIIGNNVNIEQNVHIVFVGKVHIKDNVSITGRCSIMGGSHPFFDVDDPVKIGSRLTGADSLIEIGEGCFLGLNVIVTPNVRLGRYVVVGSASVVKKSAPDYCVIEGNPATVMLRFDREKSSWYSVRKK